MIQSIWSFKVPGWCTVLEVRMAGWSLRRGNGREDCEGLFLDLAGGFLDELTLESLISLYTHGSCIFPSECSTCIKCRRGLWSGQQRNSSCVVLGPREGQCACWNQEIWVQMPAPPCPSPKPCWSFLCFLTFDSPIFLPHYRVVWGLIGDLIVRLVQDLVTADVQRIAVVLGIGCQRGLQSQTARLESRLLHLWLSDLGGVMWHPRPVSICKVRKRLIKT